MGSGKRSECLFLLEKRARGEVCGIEAAKCREFLRIIVTGLLPIS